MENQITLAHADTLDIAELEYDVAGAGSRDASDTDQNEAAFFFSYRAPAAV